MPRERVAPQCHSELIRAIVLEDSPCCGVPHRDQTVRERTVCRIGPGPRALGAPPATHPRAWLKYPTARAMSKAESVKGTQRGGAGGPRVEEDVLVRDVLLLGVGMHEQGLLVVGVLRGLVPAVVVVRAWLEQTSLKTRVGKWIKRSVSREAAGYLGEGRSNSARRCPC